MRLLCALGLFLALLHVTSCLLIGAFNIEKFGDQKSKDNVVMNIIKQIVLRYDIILIQEVIDKDLTVTKRLMDLVNEDSPQFSYIVSEPLPKSGTGYKERYLFLYRPQTVTVKSSFQYPAGKGFRRAPFVVQFSSTVTGVTDFVLIPIHTKPDKAVLELKALVKVVDYAKDQWKNNNITVLGDFNAGSKYVKESDWKRIPLCTNTKDFHWLIANGVDTTVAASIQTHDRIVVTTDMNAGVVKDSAGVFNFKTQYGLTQTEAEAVSDHFPVEVRLKPKP